MSKFTPGKWVYDPTEKYYRGKVIRHNGVVICRLLPLGIDEEAQANAQAIAALPELVEALKQILKGEGAYSKDHLTHASNTIENMKDIAQQALARVEGK